MWCYSRNISIWGKNLSIWDGISKSEDITKNESNVRSGGCSSIIIQPFELWWGLKLIGFLIVKSALSGVMLGPQCTAGFACHVFFEETIRNWKFVCGYIYILYDSLYFSDKFIMWYKHYVFSFFFVYIYICVYIYMYNTWHMDLCCQSDPYRQCWQFVTWIKTGVPSGKRLHNYGKIHHCSWEIPLFRLGHFQ